MNDDVWYERWVSENRQSALRANPTWATAYAVLALARILAIFVNRWTRLQKHENGYSLGD